jgi:hypothetical protein
MGDLIDQLPSNEKYKSQVRAAAALESDERLFDAVEVLGDDNFGTDMGGALLVTDRRVVFVKQRLVGKPKAEAFAWDNVLEFGKIEGQRIFRIRVSRGNRPWSLTAGSSEYWGSSVSDEERDRLIQDRLRLLAVTMSEAREAFDAAENARQSGSVGGMMEELRKKRGF